MWQAITCQSLNLCRNTHNNPSPQYLSRMFDENEIQNINFIYLQYKMDKTALKYFMLRHMLPHTYYIRANTCVSEVFMYFHCHILMKNNMRGVSTREKGNANTCRLLAVYPLLNQSSAATYKHIVQYLLSSVLRVFIFYYFFFRD